MDGASRTLGIGPMILIDGQHYSVKGKILRHFAEIEAEILRVRGAPINDIVDFANRYTGPVDRLKEIIGVLLDRARDWYMVTPDDAANFTKTYRGRCMVVWLAIRHNDPATLTYDKVTEIFNRHVQNGGDPEEIYKAITQANAEDVVGN